MKIFFLLRHSGFLKFYEPTLVELRRRGVELHLGVGYIDRMYPQERVDELLGRMQGPVQFEVRVQQSSPRRLSVLNRRVQNYLRYLEPAYKRADKLRARAQNLLPLWIRLPLRILLKGRQAGIRRVLSLLRKHEERAPVDGGIVAQLEGIKPDLMLVTPLIDLTGVQVDWVKAARSLGIKTIMATASWDNLTNKGLIQGKPDGLIVWNDYQVREAVDLHEYPEENVIVTGAQCFDRWFAGKPSLAREDFCERIGLDPARKIILYLCSSRFIARDENDFVSGWVARLKASPETREACVLIRPHPQNAGVWDGVSFDDAPGGPVRIYPRGGANPVERAAVADFFDTLYHCDAVVGINTSSMIEAGILDKPVFTIVENFRGTQSGTLHFRYLAEEGLITVHEDLAEHVAELGRTLNGADPNAERRRRFVVRFLRPAGAGIEATTVFCDRVLELAGANGENEARVVETIEANTN